MSVLENHLKDREWYVMLTLSIILPTFLRAGGRNHLDLD
jgi:hypothetical protein